MDLDACGCAIILLAFGAFLILCAISEVILRVFAGVGWFTT